MFFFNDTATTEIYTLSLHDALPILNELQGDQAEDDEDELSRGERPPGCFFNERSMPRSHHPRTRRGSARSEEHTSELQSRQYLVCRLLLEKKKKHRKYPESHTNHTI